MFHLFKPKAQVLVAGAGPVGLYAALNLAKRGIRVEVIDEEWRGTTKSYALALHPQSLELFERLGLAEAVLDGARKVRTVGFYHGADRRAELDLGKLPCRFPFLAILPQSQVEELLIRTLAREGVLVQYNRRLAIIDPSADQVKVRVDTLGKDSLGYGVAHSETVIERSRDWEVPLLLAADGHDSVVRTQLGIEFDAVRPPEHFAVFEFSTEKELDDEVRVVFEKDTTSVLWPVGSHRYRWSFQLRDLTAPWDSRTKDRLLMSVGGGQFPHLEQAALRQLISERAPWFQATIENVHWSIEVRFEHRLASAFGSGRVWLAGDAAHMAGPVAVQSMNVGFREVDQLCDLYGGVLAGNDCGRDFANYNADRLVEWRNLLEPAADWIADQAPSPWVAEHAVQIVSSTPSSGSLMTELLSQVGVRPSANGRASGTR